MMETTLNLLWLVVTLATVALWRLRWLPNRVNRRVRALPEAIALVCALALLFPSISLTDDLHPEIVAVDASSGKRNGCHLLASHSNLQRVTEKSTAHSTVAVFARSFGNIEPSAAHRVFFAGYLHVFSRSKNYSGRSPPSSIL